MLNQNIADFLFVGLLVTVALFLWLLMMKSLLAASKPNIRFRNALEKASPQTYKTLFPGPATDVAVVSRWEELLKQGFLEEHPELQEASDDFIEAYKTIELTVMLFILCCVVEAGSLLIYVLWIRPAA